MLKVKSSPVESHLWWVRKAIPVKWSSPQLNELEIQPQYDLPDLPQLNTLRSSSAKNITGQAPVKYASLLFYEKLNGAGPS